MKRNKPETHFRLKPYLKKWIDEIAKYTRSTMTSVVEDALEKGLTYRIKMIRKELDPNFLNGEKKQDQAQEQKYPNTFKTNDEWNQHCIENYGKTAEEVDKLSKLKWINKDE